ncbi:hypothetical protein ACTMU2_39400 [Cupriavidus basilensis]
MSCTRRAGASASAAAWCVGAGSRSRARGDGDRASFVYVVENAGMLAERAVQTGVRDEGSGLIEIVPRPDGRHRDRAQNNLARRRAAAARCAARKPEDPAPCGSPLRAPSIQNPVLATTMK